MHTVQLKPTIKVQISGRMASIGISDVVTDSVYSEKNTSEEVDVDNESIARIDVFCVYQKLTSAMKQRPEK